MKGLCLKVEYGDFDMATCGDINGVDDGSRTNVESAVVATMGDVEVAKVNHHGSSFSSNSTWVSTLDAQVSVISVGANGFGHPDAPVVARWDATGTVFQTQDPADNSMIDGTVTIVTDGASGFTTTASTSAIAHARGQQRSPARTPCQLEADWGQFRSQLAAHNRHYVALLRHA